MSFRIDKLAIRSILNSCGKMSIEAEMCVNNEFHGIGSAPAAIKAGKREKEISKISAIGMTVNYNDLIYSVENRNFTDQKMFDTYIEEINKDNELGSDLTLSLSLAFCRSCAASNRKVFFQHVADISNNNINIPYPMVNIFSGGIHSPSKNIPLQQIMIIPLHDNIVDNISTALDIYSVIERDMSNRGDLLSYASSSGMLVKNHSIDDLFKIINSTIDRLHFKDKVKLGIDVAAEHLQISETEYKYGDRILNSEDLFNEYVKLIEKYNLFYIEDPFESNDNSSWTKITKQYKNSVLIVGDDIFATNSKNIKDGLANGILLKMNQIGSITQTIAAAKKAASIGMELCISHRSCETEDTAMCDLAVGLGARYIKIGGPRRGDRISKYNQLLRISDRIKSK